MPTAPPVLFLDIDGVIAPTTGQPRYPEPVRWAKLPPGVMHFPGDVLAHLVDLHDRCAVDVHWLTSWQDDAATHLAPALGLPDQWPVHTRSSAPRWHECPLDTDWWKQRVVLAHLEAGERAIWCDDDIAYRADRDTLARLYGNRLLAISPDSGTGLTPTDLQSIEQWLTAAPDPVPAADPGLALLAELAFLDT